MYRTTLCATRYSRVVASRRLIHSSPAVAKSMTEKASEVADKVNKTVGKGLASAIDNGEKATDSAKQTMGSLSGDTKAKADEVGDEMKHTGRRMQRNAEDAGDKLKEKTGQAEKAAKRVSEEVKREM